MRMNEMVSGVRPTWRAQLYGDDLDVLAAKGKEIEAILKQIPAPPTWPASKSPASRSSEIKLNQDQLARYGVPAKVVTDVIESVGSKPVGDVIEGQLLPARDAAARDHAKWFGSDLVDPDPDRLG